MPKVDKTMDAATSINKAESTPKTTVPTSSAREIGQPRIVTASSYIQDSRKEDLTMPKRLCTFDKMCQDDAVFTSIDVTNLHVVNSMYNGKFVGKGSKKSKIAADFLNYNIRNMSYGTWWEACLNMSTDIKYGFSILNMVTEKKKYGQYANTITLKKLSPRDQKSVYAWLWNDNNTEFKGFIQKPSILNQKGKFSECGFKESIPFSQVGRYQETGYPALCADQILHFTFNKTNENPQGNSPLMNCYTAWMEKALIEKYEVIGVSKDLAGTVVLKVPSELIEKANDSANYPNEAEEYTRLQEDAANLQAGDNTYIVLTSDVDETTNTPLYDLKLQGIDGGGKQYKTSEIIDQKRKSIYNCFGAGFLLLGQDSHGSYNLSSNATSTHGYYVERAVTQKVDVLNNQLATRLLAINQVYLDYEDMPEFQAADPTEFDLDTLSKFIQRTKSVGGLTRGAITWLYEKAGLPIEDIDDIDFTDKGISRAGESNGTSGTGSTQDGGAASATNAENGGTTKSLEIDGDKIIVNDQVVNELDLDDNGNYK